MEETFSGAGMYEEIDGNIILLAKAGKFDAIVHGCNCFCAMGSGLAPQMAEAFGADKFPLEAPQNRGVKEKLGRNDIVLVDDLYVINSYTQYQPGPNADINAIRSCMKGINAEFKALKQINDKTFHIGIPLIGCGIGGLQWEDVKKVIKEEITDMRVTIIHYA